jgi:hypothetical protein
MNRKNDSSITIKLLKIKEKIYLPGDRRDLQKKQCIHLRLSAMYAGLFYFAGLYHLPGLK